MVSLSKTQTDARLSILRRWEHWLETPLLLLGVAWLVLLVVDLIWGLSPFLDRASTVIWVVFVADFALRFALAPHKLPYLRRNWLTAVSLLLPALRIVRAVRLVRVLRAARGLRLVRLLTSLNRGMRILGRTMGRRGLGYVSLLTLLVTLVGGAGMYAFERDLPDGAGLNTYGEAVWWTAMLMTTMGSEYWPRSGEGRLLCLVLSLYAFAVFGYVTAALATFFVAQDAERDQASDVAGLRTEIRALREELALRLPPVAEREPR